MNREILKQTAKQQIKGKIGILFAVTLIVVGISFIASFIPFIGSLVNTFFVSPAFSIAFIMIYFKVCDYQTFKIGEIFDGFYHFWGAFKVTFLVSLFTALWSLLLIVPGIIKGYSYSMALYIWAENKEMGALEAIKKSQQMMDGHKMDYFVLQLSFIGWILLTYVTFGLAGIYVIPYISATIINFYRSLKPISVTEEPVIETAPVVETPTESVE